MTAPGGNAIDSDMAVLFAGPLGMAMCAKKVYGWFKEGRGPQQTLDAGHEVYSEISVGQVDVSEVINKVIRDSGASWGGAAADGMRSSASPLGSWADTAGSTATAGASTVANLSSAYRTAQNSVQQPVEVPDKPWGNDYIPWDTDYDDALGKSQGVDSANMQVLNTYAETATTATSSSPKFESPNSSTANVQETPPAQIDQTKSYDGYNSNTSTSSIGTASTPPGGTTTPSWTAPPATAQHTPNLPNTPPGGNLNQPGGPLPGMPMPGGPFPGGNTNTPRPGGPTARPGVPGGPGGQSRGPGGSGPGGPGAAGAARGPGGMGSAGGLGGAAKPGSFGPLGSGGAAGVLGEQGRAGSFGPSGSGNTGAAGGRGAAGMAGGAGGGAGAGRGEGADDLEHSSKYVEPNDEAFGDDRMVAPPVIGG